MITCSEQPRGCDVPWTAWVAAALFMLVLLPKIGAGTLWHHDELLTANRAREMLVRGDPFAVTVDFVPSVKKPPLQYWICAALLRRMPGHPELALRLLTLLAGAACLPAAAWLARVSFPDRQTNGNLAAWTVLMLAGCGYLIHHSRVALLDTVAALLLTLAVAGCQRARRDTRWWWFVAGLCVLGAWQKAPYGLAAWTVVLVVRRWLGDRSREGDSAAHGTRRWPHHLPVAFAAAVLGSLGWWTIQWMHENHALLLAAGREQVGSFLRAHDPTDEGFRPWLYWAWMARDWALAGICAPVAALAACRAGRRDRARTELGWVCLLFGAALACLLYRAERYLVVVTPLLTVLTVDFLQRLSPSLPVAARRWVLPVVLAATLPAAAFQFFKPAPGYPDLLAVSRELGRTVRPEERVFVSTDADENFDEAGFILFYADLRRPLEPYLLPFLEGLPADVGPCRGICSRTQWERLSRERSAWRAVLAQGEWVLWKG